jgi:predicted ester cyclase
MQEPHLIIGRARVTRLTAPGVEPIMTRRSHVNIDARNRGSRLSGRRVSLLASLLMLLSLLNLAALPLATARDQDIPGGPELEMLGDRGLAASLFTVVLTGGQVDVASGIFSEHAFIHTEDPNATLLGAKGFELALIDLTDAFPSATFAVQSLVQNDDLVSVDWTMSGTHAGAFKGFAATGVTMGTDGTLIARFANHLIVEAWLQYNSTAIVQQIQYARSLGMAQGVYAPGLTGLAPSADEELAAVPEEIARMHRETTAGVQQAPVIDPELWAKVEIDYDGPDVDAEAGLGVAPSSRASYRGSDEAVVAARNPEEAEGVAPSSRAGYRGSDEAVVAAKSHEEIANVAPSSRSDYRGSSEAVAGVQKAPAIDLEEWANVEIDYDGPGPDPEVSNNIAPSSRAGYRGEEAPVAGARQAPEDTRCFECRLPY